MMMVDLRLDFHDSCISNLAGRFYIIVFDLWKTMFWYIYFIIKLQHVSSNIAATKERVNSYIFTLHLDNAKVVIQHIK